MMANATQNPQKIKCINPATLEVFKEVEATDPKVVPSIVDAARSASKMWGNIPYRERAAYILRARQYLLSHIDEFARAITLDNGKPLVEALTAEIFPSADLMSYFASNGERFLKSKDVDIDIWRLFGRKSSIEYVPLGVVGIISPWNYPFSIPVGTVVAALLAGNSVVLKPSSATAYVGKKIEEMFEAAGLPKHVFNHIAGSSEVGEALVNSRPDKIFFTGSTVVGTRIMEMCSKHLIPCNLELGGKDAMVVLNDAHIEHASSAAVWGAFTNAGQCCASIERVYVAKSVSEEFIEMVTKKTKTLRVGNGLDPSTDIGPLTTKTQLDIVKNQVEDAIKKGGKVLVGGRSLEEKGGWFYEPTVLTNLHSSSLCLREETFGPLMPIVVFEDEEEMLKLVNDTPYGLNCYIWSKDTKKAKRLARSMRAGTVCINECVYTHAIPATPWGGVGASGFGRTHGEIGFKEMLVPLHIHTNRITHFKDIWWYHYSEELYTRLKKITPHLSGRLTSKLMAIPGLIAGIFKCRKI
jgi:acyl-CoA reductase-like NAD-dependent aldehyde dehydrogenase